MYSRREFIGLTGAAYLGSSLASVGGPLNVVNQPGYQLLVFATNWGFTGNWSDFFGKVKAAGYDGVEVWYPSETKDREEFQKAVSDYGLQYGFLVGGSDQNADRHYAQFRESLEGAVRLKPVYINCHSGRDYFSFDENRKFMDLTSGISKQHQVPVYHETHRSRILYAAPVARQFMEKLPDLRLTFDVSHWCNVHESLLEDQAETLSLAISRTDHIHARIGHAEGPQVNDPRAPEWKKAFDAHLAWWDRIVENKKREGARMTFLTEFGPVDYMPAVPYTRQPLSNQWEINTFMLDVLRKRYS